ncbi:unnamed protein product [Clavelina lepadiformis]|uniref:Proton-coupled folate transporter n=2 Tax=Clavelina lepadiformis TaxID=159417 RepID=A0ABP0GMV4_CLALP
MGLSWLQQKLQALIQVDIIIAIGGFCCMLLDPLKNEYIYLKVAEGHNATRKLISDCHQNETSSIDILVQQEVSRWTLLLDLILLLPASLTAILITSWGDRVGRKITMSIPVAGMTASCVSLAVSIYFEWSLKAIFLSNFLAGISGYYMTLLVQGNAYLSDITPSENRGMRFVILDTALGVGGGVGAIVSGYWVKAEGFFMPIACTAVLSFLSLLLIPLLADSRKIRDKISEEKKKNVQITESGECSNNNNDEDYLMSADRRSSYGSSSSISQHTEWDNNNEDSHKKKKKKYNVVDLMRAVWKVYSSDYSHCVKCHGPINEEHKYVTFHPEKCIHGGGRYPGRIWRMWFYLFAYNFNMFVIVGGMIFQTIYLLSKPLCFTPVLVGIQSGFKFGLIALSPLIVLIYQKVLKMTNHMIILTALVAVAASDVVMSFATHSAIVFIATSLMLFANTAKPFIQAQISSIVSDSEQGAAFALLSFTEILSFLTSTVSFLMLYSATVGIYHGFAWLVAAAIVIIPFSLIMTVVICDRKRSLDDNEKEPLLHNVVT